MLNVKKTLTKILAFVRCFHFQIYAQLPINTSISITSVPYDRVVIGIPTYSVQNYFTFNVTFTLIPANETSYKFTNVGKNDGNFVNSGNVDYVLIFLPYF